MSHHVLNTPQCVRKITLRSFPYECNTYKQEGLGSQDAASEFHPDISPQSVRQGEDPSFHTSPREDSARKDGYTLAPSNISIFVIDDSVTIRTMVKTTLCQAGYETMAFQNGMDAMKWLTEPGSRVPDLIFVDLSLPEMDGYEVIRMFKKRAQLAKTSYIILSRRDGMADKLKGRLVGAQGYIIKPFTANDLLSAVRSYLLQRPV